MDAKTIGKNLLHHQLINQINHPVKKKLIIEMFHHHINFRILLMTNKRNKLAEDMDEAVQIAAEIYSS